MEPTASSTNPVSQITHDAESTLSGAADQTRRKAAEYANTAKVQGQEMLDHQKHRAAEQLHTVGEAVHRAAEKFREDRDDNIAGYVDALAEEVDRFADYLDKRDLTSLVRDSQSFARREPEWFLGGMFLAGLALTRFLKSSGRGDEGDSGGYSRMQPPETSSSSTASTARPGSDEPWAPERSITGAGIPPQSPSSSPATRPIPEVH